MNETALYFSAAIHAHFLAVAIALYSLYETRRDSINIPNAVREAPQIVQSALEARLIVARQLWKKVSVVRNECLAHVSLNFSTAEVFKKAALCTNDLKHLIDLSREIVNEIAYAQDRSSPAIVVDPTDETRNILNQLKKNIEIEV